MRADKIRELDNAELKLRLKDMNEQIHRLRIQVLMGQAEGLKKYRALRKDRARVLTVLRERELAASAAK